MNGYDSPCCFRSSEIKKTRRLLWEVTTRCNLSCGFCFRTPGQPGDITPEECERVIPFLNRIGIEDVIISGGEPFLLPWIMEIAHLLKSQGFSVDICTNGTKLTAETVAATGEVFSEVSVSLDSHDAKIHDALRGVPGSWERAVRGIRQLVRRGVQVHSISVVNQRTLPGIVECAKFLSSLGVKSTAFIAQGNAPNRYFNPLCSPEIDVFRNAISEARAEYPDIQINTKGFPARQGFVCPAGDTVFGLDAKKALKPCILLDEEYQVDFTVMMDGAPQDATEMVGAGMFFVHGEVVDTCPGLTRERKWLQQC